MQILLAKDQTIAQSESLLKQQFQQMPLVIRQYSELQRELGIATDSLTRFLQTYQSLQIQASQNEIPWELIAEPKPPYAKPGGSASKAIMSGFLGGLVFGAIIAYILEKLENTFYTIDEVRKKVRLQLLGVIPLHGDLNIVRPGMHVIDLGIQIEKNYIPLTPASASAELGLPASADQLDGVQQRQVNSEPQNQLAVPASNDLIELTRTMQPTSAPRESNRDYWLQEYGAYGFLEAFRTLYANIERLDQQPIQSIVISSALPGEGRTTVAIHLAQAAAAMGKRVLLVDAHLRKGGTQMHTLLGLPEHAGLGDYLTGTASLQQIVQSLSWESGLFLIGAGEIPLDPTRILASEKMHDLMAQLSQSFDLVIYDMLPLMGLADVKLVAAQTDGIMLVTSLGKRATIHALGQTIDRLEAARLSILGIVVNKAKRYSVDLYA